MTFLVLRLLIDQLTAGINTPATTGVTGSPGGRNGKKVVLANQDATNGHERYYNAGNLTVLLLFGGS